MSYDFSVRLETGNEPAFVGGINYTCNVYGMFARALKCESINKLHDKRLGDLRDCLQAGVHDMRSFQAAYRAMNPPNGWGDHAGALRVLETLLEWSEKYPNGFLHIT